MVTAFQSASGLVNIITPSAAVLMGALALGRVPYEKWVKFVWKLLALFLALTLLLLMAGVLLGKGTRSGERRAPSSSAEGMLIRPRCQGG